MEGQGSTFSTGRYDAAWYTQWLQAALVPVQGTDNLDAIRVLRRTVDQLRAMPYDSNLGSHFPHIECTDPPIPSVAQLYQNYPNPFNAGTTIRYDLDRPAQVRIAVYDLPGREVSVLKEGGNPRGLRR